MTMIKTTSSNKRKFIGPKKPSESSNDYLARYLCNTSIKKAYMDEDDNLVMLLETGEAISVSYSCYGGVSLVGEYEIMGQFRL